MQIVEVVLVLRRQPVRGGSGCRARRSNRSRAVVGFQAVVGDGIEVV